MLHQKIGNYYLESELGSGGFGRVYRGRHTILTEREVAVKILHSFINTLEEREQFLQEAHLLERLKHPHILHIFDVGVSEGFPYIVSAFANEGSLADLLKTSAPHPLAEDIAIEIIAQVGEGLLFAHQQQVIHRDLKPENILFDHGIAFLADFGIAVTLATASVKNVTITGTPPYMAPEQFQGQVSKESDQYGLACIAYELVSGRQPFTAPDFFSMGFQHLSTPPIPPSQYNPNISPHVEHAILKAMSKQRTDRFESLRDFMSALRPVSSSSGPLPATLFAQTRPTTTYVPVEESRFRHLTDESDLLTLPSSKNEAIPRQSPVTPILFAGLPTETPPDPITPVPPSFDESAAYFKTQRSASSMYQAVPPASGQYNPTVNAFPYTDKPYIVPNTPFVAPEKQNPRRMLIAGVSFILVACLVGILLFTTILHGKSGTPSSTNALTLVASTTTLPTSNARGSAVASKGSTPRSGPGITTRTTTTGVTTVPTSSVPGTTVTPGVTATQGQTTSPATNATQAPTTAPTQAPTATPTPTPTPTDTPVPTPTDTPVPTPTNTPVPTPTPTSPPVVGTTETVYAYLTGGSYSVQTANSYSGTVQISVSGVGQAYDVSCYSDAFYVYTDQSGNAITPFHDTTSPNWVMTINGEHTDYFVSLPAYNSSHTYTFTMTAPGGTLSFGVDDNVTSDDTGYYAVTVTQE